MPIKFKPTSDECRIIRDCAKRSSGHKAVQLCPGERHNTETDRGRNLNIALVSDHPDWDDTDLWSNANDWTKDFRGGVELTDDGRGIFDFYVYSLGYDGELETNVVAYYENRRLVRVEGVGDGVMWKAKEIETNG